MSTNEFHRWWISCLFFLTIFRRMKKWHGAEIELSMKLCSLTCQSGEMSSTETRKKAQRDTEKEKDIKYQNTRIDFFGKRRRALSHRLREFLTRNSFSPHFSCKFTIHTIITHSGSSGNLYICATWLGSPAHCCQHERSSKMTLKNARTQAQKWTRIL